MKINISYVIFLIFNVFKTIRSDQSKGVSEADCKESTPDTSIEDRTQFSWVSCLQNICQGLNL